MRRTERAPGGRSDLHVVCWSRLTGDSPKRQIPPRGPKGRVLGSPFPELPRPRFSCIVFVVVQKLCEINLQVYLAADNPFDVVSRPEVCARCQERESFHRHGVYWRYVQETRCKVARFLCKKCRLTVSVLPAFVLPYRSRLVEDVDRYFEATPEARREQPGADTLRHYWRQWCGHAGAVRLTGWPAVRPLAPDPLGYWRQLRTKAGSVACAQVQLVRGFGLSLLRRYACHRVPARVSIDEAPVAAGRAGRPTHPLG